MTTEHGREVVQPEKKTIKSKLLEGKKWLGDHKGEIVVMGIAGTALLTYATYHIFEGRSYDNFEDMHS